MTPPGDDWIWPAFEESELVDRLLMDDDAFHRLWVETAASMPVREFDDAAFALGTGYPWPRPDGSFLLAEGEGRLLADLDPDTRSRTIAAFTGSASQRTPMLAIGSNASPEGLWRKFGHFEDPADRTLLALTRKLHDFDVGASAELALYGALPATLFPSPGTRVDVTAIWLTDVQLTQLAWAEIPYRIGRLDTTFEFDPAISASGPSGFGSALVFINRFGAFAPEGKPIPLEKIPAERRIHPPAGQVELLGMTAEMAFGPGASAEDLVRRAFEHPGETGRRVAGLMRSNSIPFESDRWTPYPG